MRALERLASGLHCVSQAWAWQEEHSSGVASTAGAHAVHVGRCYLQSALMVVQLGCLAFFLLAPQRAWRRHRSWFIGGMRLCVSHEPWMGRTQAGLGRLLNRAASPGVFGAAADWLRVAAGLRLFPLLYASLIFSLPPVAALVQQAAALYLGSAAAGAGTYCATPLLSDALSGARVAVVCGALDSAHGFLPTPLGGSWGGRSKDARPASALTCWLLLSMCWALANALADLRFAPGGVAGDVVGAW
ncbi:iron ABC transporter permease [Micractinium conductrix]|uniref:Iron ABC transporter permease n=1 Tax=Micractinium conductrix TaxID=554055 RepID=A0A2P6VHT4_9CHLO|nr:iron ABC transporter permease [Micractinium conductrix]|eukprot:PSC73653.1 iron ABC transporter permease [Micractinium conductrix]